jgi:hypothetical protein
VPQLKSTLCRPPCLLIYISYGWSSRVHLRRLGGDPAPPPSGPRHAQRRRHSTASGGGGQLRHPKRPSAIASTSPYLSPPPLSRSSLNFSEARLAGGPHRGSDAGQANGRGGRRPRSVVRRLRAWRLQVRPALGPAPVAPDAANGGARRPAGTLTRSSAPACACVVISGDACNSRGCGSQTRGPLLGGECHVDRGAAKARGQVRSDSAGLADADTGVLACGSRTCVLVLAIASYSGTAVAGWS